MSYGQRQINVPAMGKANKYLLIAMVVSLVLDSILVKAAGFSLKSIFGLSAGNFFGGHIYEILTYPLMGGGLLEVVFNGLIIWFIGSELESMWGMKRYLSFVLTATIGAGVIYLLINLFFFSASPTFNFPLTGMSGAASALCVAYAVLYPDRIFSFMMLFPVKAKYFCMLLIGMTLFNGFFSQNAALAWGHIGAMASGYIFMFAVSHPRFKDIFSNAKKGMRDAKRKSKVDKSHLKLVKSDKDDEKKTKYWH